MTALLPLAFLIGGIPFSYLVGRITRRINPKEMKAGTVSGTALYLQAGFAPLVLAGILDMGKAILVSEIFRSEGHLIRSIAVAIAVAGHNWSPFLKGAGGRGIAPTMGGMGFVAWPATLWIIGCMSMGRLLERTGFIMFWAYLSMPLVVLITSEPGIKNSDNSIFNLNHHIYATIGALIISCVVFLKRAMGDKQLQPDSKGAFHRLLYDSNT